MAKEFKMALKTHELIRHIRCMDVCLTQSAKYSYVSFLLQPPFIEIQTKEIRRKRSKRQLDCAQTGRETRCCRYPLRVDFRQFGWDWVIAPDVYDAYYCSGECPQGYLPRYHHSYVSQLGSSFSPCCSPRKLSSLSLLYYDNNKQVIHSIIPNMAVDKCSCS